MNRAILKATSVRGVLSVRERARHQCPQVRQFTADQPRRTGLDQHITDGRRLDRAGQHLAARPIGSKLAKQRVLAASADDVHGADLLTAEPLRVVNGVRVGLGEALQNAARDHGRRARGSCSTLSAECRNPIRHVAWRKQAWVVCVEHRRRRGDRRRLVEQRTQLNLLPLALPGADRLAEQPHTHHVAQVANLSVNPALVGEIGLPAVITEYRSVQLNPHQRPRPDDTYAAPGSTIGTPTTADAVSCDPTAISSRDAGAPTSAATSVRSEPIRRPASTNGGNSVRGRPSLSIRVAFQSPLATSTRPVVEPLVRSTTCCPVSQKPSRSGIISMRTDSSIRPASASTASWYRLLNGWNCSPFAAYRAP